MNDETMPLSGFAAFLPPEYRGEFSRAWLMGLSPFGDNTCAGCYSVQRGQWVRFGERAADERALKCQREPGTDNPIERGDAYGKAQQPVAE